MTDIGIRKARCLVDTGADVSVIGRDALDRLQLPLQDFEGGQHPTITQADQSAIEFAGVVRCGLYLAGTVIPHVFYVSNDRAFQTPQYDVILGNDLLRRLGVLTVDYAKRIIKLRDVDNKAEFLFEMQGDKCILMTEGASSCWLTVGPPGHFGKFLPNPDDPRLATPPPPARGGSEPPAQSRRRVPSRQFPTTTFTDIAGGKPPPITRTTSQTSGRRLIRPSPESTPEPEGSDGTSNSPVNLGPPSPMYRPPTDEDDGQNSRDSNISTDTHRTTGRTFRTSTTPPRSTPERATQVMVSNDRSENFYGNGDLEAGIREMSAAPTSATSSDEPYLLCVLSQATRTSGYRTTHDGIQVLMRLSPANA